MRTYEDAIRDCTVASERILHCNAAIDLALSVYRSVCLAGPELMVLSGKMYIHRQGSKPEPVHLMSEVALMQLIQDRQRARVQRDTFYKEAQRLKEMATLKDDAPPAKGENGLRFRLINDKIERDER